MVRRSEGWRGRRGDFHAQQCGKRRLLWRRGGQGAWEGFVEHGCSRLDEYSMKVYGFVQPRMADDRIGQMPLRPPPRRRQARPGPTGGLDRPVLRWSVGNCRLGEPQFVPSHVSDPNSNENRPICGRRGADLRVDGAPLETYSSSRPPETKTLPSGADRIAGPIRTLCLGQQGWRASRSKRGECRRIHGPKRPATRLARPHIWLDPVRAVHRRASRTGWQRSCGLRRATGETLPAR